MATISKTLANRSGKDSDMSAEEVQDYIQAIKRIATKERVGLVYIVERLDDDQTQVRMYGNRLKRIEGIRYLMQAIKVRWHEKLRVLFM